MHPALLLLLTFAIFYCLALLLYPLLKWRHHYLPIAVAVLLFALIESINLIPRDYVVQRAFACLLCGHLLFSMVDFVRDQQRTDEKASFSEYLHLLIPFPALLVVFREKQKRLPEPSPLRAELPRIAIGLPISAGAFALVLLTHRVELIRQYFLLDHCVKLFLFIVFLEATAQWMSGVERLLGYSARPIVDRCFLSRTPGEFWQRYNVRVGSWLYHNVFVLSGGRRKPVRGVMVVFLISAIFHELFFGIATSRFTGYQATFFLLQTPAVVISPYLDRFAVACGNLGKAVARLLTVLWFTFTSMLFFHGLDQVFPFYYANEPWL